MDAFTNLWGGTATVLSTAILLHNFNMDSVLPFSSITAGSHQLVDPNATLPGKAAQSLEDKLFYPVVTSSSRDVLSSRCRSVSHQIENELIEMNSPITTRQRALHLPELLVVDPHQRYVMSPVSVDNTMYSTALSEMICKSFSAHYLWSSRRTLEQNLEAVQRMAEGHPSNDPISILMCGLREATDRLFPLLPLDRLCDYLVPSDVTSANLEEVAKVAAQVLIIVENLYLACADEKAPEGDRGCGVSLHRLRMLNCIFAEPNEEDSSHLDFLAACLASPSTALAASGSYASLEDALRALLRIRPLESKLRDGIIRNDAAKSVLDQGEERELLFRIAAQLVSPVRSTKTVDLTFPVTRPEGLPLFEMLTAPFIMLSKVDTGDFVLEAFNSAAGTLLRSHSGTDLSGFRFFATNETKLDVDSDVHSYEVAQWFQELAAGLKGSVVAAQDGNLCMGSVDWLCGPGGLHEVTLREAVESQETLLAALEQGAADTRGGVSLVVMDIPSGTIFGVDASAWQGSINGLVKNEIQCETTVKGSAQRIALLFRFVLRMSPTSSLASSGGLIKSSGYSRMPTLLSQINSDRSWTTFTDWGAAAESTVKPSPPDDRCFAIPVPSFRGATRQVSFDSRSNDVEEVKLRGFVSRLEKRTKVNRVAVAPGIDTVFIVNESLMSIVIQEVMQYIKASGLPTASVVLNRCGMHLVVDLLPQQAVQPPPDVRSSTYSQITKYYQTLETPGSPLLPFSKPSQTNSLAASCDWIDSVLVNGRLREYGAPVYLHCPSNRQIHLSWSPKGPAVSSQSSLMLNWSDPSQLHDQRSPSPACVQPDQFPDVWAVQASEDPSGATESSMVPPTNYLTTRTCELLVSIKAAVVMMNTGATTIAFPFISQNRVLLLKQMNLVNQPISAAADLGIVELNRMACGAVAARLSMSREDGKKGHVIPLAYSSGAVSEMVSVLPTKSAALIPESGWHEESPLSLATGSADPVALFGTSPESPAYESPRDSLRDSSKLEVIASSKSSAGKSWIDNQDLLSLVSSQKSRDLHLWSSYDDWSNNSFNKAVGRTQGPPADESSIMSPPCLGQDLDKHYNIMIADPTSNISFIDLSAMPNSVRDTSRVGFPYVHVLFISRKPPESLMDLLLNIGHSITCLTDMRQICCMLRCGVAVYDAVLIDWHKDIATPHVRELVAAARANEPYIPVLFAVMREENELDDAHPPVPEDVLPQYIVDTYDICTSWHNKRTEMRSFIRLGRIMKDLRTFDYVRFQIKQRIGSGSFGDVYEVSMYASKGRLALKKIPLGAVTPERMEQLYKEAMIMRELDHRNIVQLSHINCDDTTLYLFMELCDYTLKDVLDTGKLMNDFPIDPYTPLLPCTPVLDIHQRQSAFQRSTGIGSVSSLGLRAASDIPTSLHSAQQLLDVTLLMKDILSAVNYLHSYDIVHRDLKPQNILFLNGVAKLADFGTATTVSAKQSALHTMKGTIPYMAPEVFLGEPYRKSCDIWSLGIIICEILGIRFAHTTLLHYPALQAYYKSLDEDESMPVVITNFVCTGLQKHLTDELVDEVKAALQEARQVARAEQKKRRDARRNAKFSGAMLAAGRTVFAIEVDAKLERCSMSQHSLPATLVELLESTFFRNPERRVTAEQLLEHPIANEKEWMVTMMADVSQLNARIAFQDSHEEGSQQLVDLSFSDSGGSDIG